MIFRKILKSFGEFDNKRSNKKVILNDYTILSFIEKSRGNLRTILKLISERLTQEYIIVYYTECENVIKD